LGELVQLVNIPPSDPTSPENRIEQILLDAGEFQQVLDVGTGNVPMVDFRGNPTDSWFSADIPPPELTPPPPPPPGQPFCTPRGGLFIVGPICDEIGH
jgi:hypothetical protein